jgi:CheY-like chemotaxis protein
MAEAKQTKILIVDDDQDLREIIAIDFENLGFLTATAEDGMAALAMIAKETFDVVVTDLRMPTLGGLGLYQKVLEMKLPKVPTTIFITGFSDVNVVDALDLGVADYIEKPFSRRSLISSVQWHLKSNALKWGETSDFATFDQAALGVIQQNFFTLDGAVKSGNLKIGRGGFAINAEVVDPIPTPGTICKFLLEFKEANSIPWSGYGRIRWVTPGSVTGFGVEILCLNPDALKSVLQIQGEILPQSYIPKF